MNVLVFVNKERGDMRQYEEAENIRKILQKQGFSVSISELSFMNPCINYYDSFPRVNINDLVSADVAVVLSGDGSKNYIANCIKRNNLSIPMIGVSMGSHNVGKLNTATVNDFNVFDSFINKKVSGLKIEVDGEAYYAFHDIIFASTFVTGYNGKSSQLSAKEIMNGVKKQEPPKIIGDGNTSVSVIRKDNSITKMPHFESLGIISSAELASYPKYMVMSGAANLPINEGAQAGVIISSERLVWPDRTLEDYWKAEPIVTAFASYSNGDCLKISGLNEDAYLIIDGNAVCAVGNREITISSSNEAISVKASNNTN